MPGASPPGAPRGEEAKGGGGRNGAPTEDMQIICVGLMRTGLKTLHKALRMLGHDNIFDQEQIVSTYEQWDEVMHNKIKDDTWANIFKGSQVAMGMPTFCFWESMLSVYPDAKVILTVRDEDDWFRSLQKAKSMMDNDMPGAPLCHGSLMMGWERFLVPSYHQFCEVLRFAWSVTLGGLPKRGELNATIVRSNYRKHNTYVQSLLRDKMTSKGGPQLLVYNVREGWHPLCEFLGVDCPSEEFPAVMEVPYFPGQLSRQAHSHPADVGQEFENLLMPESDFGMRVRQELRRGLVVVISLLALVVLPILLFAIYQGSRFVQGLLALIYFVLILIAWESYVVMHTVVMRVPALVVLPVIMKSLLIATSLQACFITYAFLKEQIVTQDHIASPVLILSARLMSVLCGAVALLAFEGRIHFAGTPLHKFFWFGFTNEASTWAGYEMLKYVSFPVQVMAKSCKLLPTMLMGKMLNGTSYKWSEYAQAIGAMVCVTVMHLSEGEKEKDTRKATKSDDIADWIKGLCGIALLIVFFACDSFTSNWQTALYKKYDALSKTQMMLAGNLMGLVITIISIVPQWPKVSSSLAVAFADPAVMLRIFLLGLSAALGQFCIYTAIKVLGPLAFTWIMTIRQLVSVLISLVWFGHGVNFTKIMCIFTVFAIMSSKQLAKAGPAIKKSVAKCRARGSSCDASPAKGSLDKKPDKTPVNVMRRATQIWGAEEDDVAKKDD
mmetsp:Transcript_13618/g.38334  ORF Transcript_13618/g.38334 Transcript_13618/m.38334 type:complete len:723 (-) Transcript_13618:126-2294(-)